MVARPFCLLSAAFALVAGAAERAPAANPACEMAAGYLRMELAGQVVAEAKKLAEANVSAREEILTAANDYRAKVADGVKQRLMSCFSDRTTAMKTFGDFVNRFLTASTGGDSASLAALARELEITPEPKDAGALRAAILKRDLAADVAAGGDFLAGLQAKYCPQTKAPEKQKPRPKKKRKANPLRDAEATAGDFVEAKDDGASSLRSFGAMRKERRKKAMEEAKTGMEQVAAERKTADDEANARRLAAAQAEATAREAQAQRLAAAEQEAAVQEENSWRTRIRGVLTTAIGAAGGAFAGSIGDRVGEAAARAVLNPK